MMDAVFDTNIVIDALNGVAEADTEYTRYGRVLISRITWMETLVGAEGDDSQLREFLETHFDIMSIDLATAETAVPLRRSHRLRLPDAIIWATAQAHGAVLVTRNTKDFRPEWDGVRVPYAI
ncbi:MAG: type II toxin-antitoxin system VapC family toxin [Deltaproteobacteria bacterium]|nr:type II toxin-antitoxin system VapC family toxin [Deltaproteobacteria bacterium]MBF0526648.1 type II toxin-antitoxin system VapC family toxin [Deltaproteobacteria bacterium]